MKRQFAAAALVLIAVLAVNACRGSGDSRASRAFACPSGFEHDKDGACVASEESGTSAPVSTAAPFTRREHVARLVLDGNTYRDIADTLDVSLATIADDVQALREAYRERYAEDFATHASIELAKLDRAEQVLWPQIDDGKLAAIETFVKISRRRAQLLGLDRPERIEAVVASPTPASRSELPKTLGQLLEVDEEAAREMAKVIHMAAKRKAGGDGDRAMGYGLRDDRPASLGP
jgi:DNA-binding CsgD family transcriptional regulator